MKSFKSIDRDLQPDLVTDPSEHIDTDADPRLTT